MGANSYTTSSDAGNIPTAIKFKTLKRNIRKKYPKAEADALIARLEANKKQIKQLNAGKAYR